MLAGEVYEHVREDRDQESVTCRITNLCKEDALRVKSESHCNLHLCIGKAGQGHAISAAMNQCYHD